MKQNTYIRNLPANHRGKDYVVGDLHGCLDLLLRLLEEVKFDQSRDRLFSVGDLIDRGPNSLVCLHLLAEPWFHAVQGNHENMLLNFFLPYLQQKQIDNLDEIDRNGFLEYGGEWVKRYFLARRKCMTPQFDYGLLLALKLPLMLVVGEGEDRFHVIHAELVKPREHNSNEWIWLDSDIDQWLDQKAIPNPVEERLCWSRTLMFEAERQALPAVKPWLSPTFCGHTPCIEPRQVLSHICLDTGAFLSMGVYQDEDVGGHSLTLLDVKEARWVSTSYLRETSIWGSFSNSIRPECLV